MRTTNNEVLLREGHFRGYIYYMEVSENLENNNIILKEKKNSDIVDFKIISGDSGSPLFNRKGELEGIIFAQEKKIMGNNIKNTLTRKEEEQLVFFGFATKFQHIKPTYDTL